MARRPGSAARWAMSGLVVAVVCGLGFVAAAVTSDGSDLRPAGGDLNAVLADRAHEVETKRAEAAALQHDVDRYANKVDDDELQKARRKVEQVAAPAGTTAVEGPGMRIVLDDAPRNVDVPGVNPNELVVHQQDIQAFVNALWAGGAEAVTLQGQRMITTTGIKCVGNTVVLDGVPYAPPYVIEAIGNQFSMNAALDESAEVRIYTQYARKYGLGLKRGNVDRVRAPAFSGAIELRHATVVADPTVE